jgi:hypothetical protein
MQRMHVGEDGHCACLGLDVQPHQVIGDPFEFSEDRAHTAGIPGRTDPVVERRNLRTGHCKPVLSRFDTNLEDQHVLPPTGREPRPLGSR